MFFKEIGRERCWEPGGNRLDAICLIYIKVPIGFPLDSRYGSRCVSNKIKAVPVVPAVFVPLASGARARDTHLHDFLPSRFPHVLSMFSGFFPAGFAAFRRFPCCAGRRRFPFGAKKKRCPPGRHHSTAAVAPPKREKPPEGGFSGVFGGVRCLPLPPALRRLLWAAGHL